MAVLRVLIYVQHLLGVGHLARAATLARALAGRGLEVTLVSGGMAVAGFDLGGARLVQLPPVRARDLSFSALVDDQDKEIDDDWRRRRAERLMAVWHQVQPHAIIVEMFPFGRRQMRFELLPWLEAVRAEPHPPLVLSSIRDILVEKAKPGRTDEVVATVQHLFDKVLVHGDPALVGLGRTFSGAKRLAGHLVYTGYVVEPVPAGEPAVRDEVLVSAGGGAVGENLLSTAMAARPLSRAATRNWRFLVGGGADTGVLERLAGMAPHGVVVERARPDFRHLLVGCALSISQAGYNTVAEVLAAGARSVLVPFAAAGETEQSLRADLLARRGLAVTLAEADLDPAGLAAAIDAALALPVGRMDLDLNGAQRTAELVQEWIAI